MLLETTVTPLTSLPTAHPAAEAVPAPATIVRRPTSATPRFTRA